MSLGASNCRNVVTALAVLLALAGAIRRPLLAAGSQPQAIPVCGENSAGTDGSFSAGTCLSRSPYEEQLQSLNVRGSYLSLFE